MRWICADVPGSCSSMHPVRHGRLSNSSGSQRPATTASPPTRSRRRACCRSSRTSRAGPRRPVGCSPSAVTHGSSAPRQPLRQRQPARRHRGLHGLAPRPVEAAQSANSAGSFLTRVGRPTPYSRLAALLQETARLRVSCRSTVSRDSCVRALDVGGTIDAAFVLGGARAGWTRLTFPPTAPAAAPVPPPRARPRSPSAPRSDAWAHSRAERWRCRSPAWPLP